MLVESRKRGLCEAGIIRSRERILNKVQTRCVRKYNSIVGAGDGCVPYDLFESFVCHSFRAIALMSMLAADGRHGHNQMPWSRGGQCRGRGNLTAQLSREILIEIEAIKATQASTKLK